MKPQRPLGVRPTIPPELQPLFDDWGGKILVSGDRTFTSFPSAPRVTVQGTPYLQGPGVTLTAQTHFERDTFSDFLNGFEEFEGYLQDPDRGRLYDSEAHVKTAGQLCYLSFGEARTKDADASAYLAKIREEKHGSTYEHVSFSLLLWGVSRSFTHELVRHRIAGYSQVSQRYVGPKTLRFVERPEFVADPKLHAAFCDRIDATARVYEALLDELLRADPLETRAELPAQTRARKTAKTKAVRQTARAVLPNETEAPIEFTMNGRAVRHFLEQRGSQYAEPEIRAVGLRSYMALHVAAPHLFADYRMERHPDPEDPIGWVLVTDTPKI